METNAQLANGFASEHHRYESKALLTQL